MWFVSFYPFHTYSVCTLNAVWFRVIGIRCAHSLNWYLCKSTSSCNWQVRHYISFPLKIISFLLSINYRFLFIQNQPINARFCTIWREYSEFELLLKYWIMFTTNTIGNTKYSVLCSWIWLFHILKKIQISLSVSSHLTNLLVN